MANIQRSYQKPAIVGNELSLGAPHHAEMVAAAAVGVVFIVAVDIAVIIVDIYVIQKATRSAGDRGDLTTGPGLKVLAPEESTAGLKPLARRSVLS